MLMNDKFLLYNAKIITMANEEIDKQKKFNAILIENGKIKKVGKYEDIIKKDKDFQSIDLNGKTIMPGFIDSHSHITALAQTLGIVSLKGCKNFEDIEQRIKKYIEEKNPQKGEWIVAHGYDHNFLEEEKHPTKRELDKITLDYPVIIVHTSGHMGVVNTLGLNKLKIDKTSKDPEGGTIGRIEGTKEPNGYLEENAFIQNSKKTMHLSIEEKINLLKKAQDVYMKNGITTAQDGITKQEEFELLKEASKRKKLKIDVISYVDIKDYSNILEDNKDYVEKYRNRYKIGGYKLFLDGSPQAKTAWLSKPYESEKEYRGYGIYKDEEVQKYVRKSLEEEKQLITHCNGDQAAEQLITAFEKEACGKTIKTRPVMIHAQTVRYDQIDRMKKLKMIPSYFITHIYYWGDIHIKNLGDRAYRISPANYTKLKNMKFTFHQDTPVLSPNMLELVWTAVNRKTKEGITLGEEEKIDVYEAFKAITIYGAYQYFEDDRKGTIEEGKLADLVVIDKSPLEVDKQHINNIKVEATIKEGKIIYKLKS